MKVKVRALTRLYDRETGSIHVVGEVFETSPERAKRLGDSVVILEESKKEEPEKEEPETKEVKEAPEDKMVKKAKTKRKKGWQRSS